MFSIIKTLKIRISENYKTLTHLIKKCLVFTSDIDTKVNKLNN